MTKEEEIAKDVDLVLSAVTSKSNLRPGSGLLARSDVADQFCQCLEEKRGQMYALHSFCVMPNHVHLIISPSQEYELSQVMKHVKGRSAFLINRICERQGSLWQRESFDHLIRSSAHLERFQSYIEDNPVKAGLCSCPEDWAFSSAHPKYSMDSPDQILNLPFTPLRTRGELPHLTKDGGTYFITFRVLDSVKFQHRRHWSDPPLH